jgi:hypothetical protein
MEGVARFLNGTASFFRMEVVARFLKALLPSSAWK